MGLQSRVMGVSGSFAGKSTGRTINPTSTPTSCGFVFCSPITWSIAKMRFYGLYLHYFALSSPVNFGTCRAIFPLGFEVELGSLLTLTSVIKTIMQTPEEQRKRRYLSHKRWYDSHVIERRAHRAVSNALKAGRLNKPENCQRCGAAGKIEGHHQDYYKQLEVEWLCKKCHGTTRRYGTHWWRDNALLSDNVQPYVPEPDLPRQSNFSIYLKTIEKVKEIASRVEGRGIE